MLTFSYSDARRLAWLLPMKHLPLSMDLNLFAVLAGVAK